MNIQATGKLILTQRKQLGITQRQLGEKLGVTNAAVSKWERGLSYPDVTLLPSLATELNISISEIIRGSRNNETEQSESDTTAKEVISIADTQIKKGKKNLKKIIIVFSVILAALIIAFATTAAVLASSSWDHSKWQSEITVQSYFDEGIGYTLPLKARIGNPDAYYGKSFIVIKDIKDNRKTVLKKVKDAAHSAGNETVDLNGVGILIIDKENVGNGYIFICDRPERSENIYFYSAGAMLKNGKEDNGIPIAFPLYLLDEPVYNSIYEGVEYRFGYGTDVTEQVKNDYIDKFISFYASVGGYDVDYSDSALTVTQISTRLKITLYFDKISGFGVLKITR